MADETKKYQSGQLTYQRAQVALMMRPAPRGATDTDFYLFWKPHEPPRPDTDVFDASDTALNLGIAAWLRGRWFLHERLKNYS